MNDCPYSKTRIYGENNEEDHATDSIIGNGRRGAYGESVAARGKKPRRADRHCPVEVREILERTTRKPWRNEPFVAGSVGGTWNGAMTEDPKSFNHLIAEQDGTTAGIVGATTEALINYNVVTRQWEPLCASPEVIINEAAGTLDVVYTLRENLYWTYYNSSRCEPVTSDDVVFWYNDISGDPDMGSSSYYQQFVVMPDGSEAHMDFGPRIIYEIDKRG